MLGLAEHSMLAKADQGRWGGQGCVEQSQKVGHSKRHSASGRLDAHAVAVPQTPWEKEAAVSKKGMKADKWAMAY
jgi:hypothetical protein